MCLPSGGAIPGAGGTGGRLIEEAALAAARETVRACLPEAPVEHMEPLGDGDHSRAFLMEDAVVRIPRHAEARTALEREARLLGALGTMPAPTPRPRFVVAPGGAPALSVHAVLPGTELRRERWESLPANRREPLARDVGRFLRHLHRLDPDAAAGLGLPVLDHRPGARMLTGRLEGARRIPGALRAPLLRALERVAEMEAGATAVLHGDFGPGHLLTDPDGREITAVLDWGDACLGDPARDFIFVYEDWGDDFLSLALEGYASDDPVFLERILLHYLTDQLAWTLDASDRALPGGLEGLTRVLEDLQAR